MVIAGIPFTKFLSQMLGTDNMKIRAWTAYFTFLSGVPFLFGTMLLALLFAKGFGKIDTKLFLALNMVLLALNLAWLFYTRDF